MIPKGILAGLGNPGEQYSNTRHNYGFHLLDYILELAVKRKSMHLALVQKSGDAFAWLATLANTQWLLIKPLTYMNKSGIVIAHYAHCYGLRPEAVIVAHDELDLPMGRIKLQNGGSSAGHNGVASIINALGNPNFWRLRLGIGRPLIHRDITNWVLEPFSPAEHNTTGLILSTAWKGLDLFLRRSEALAVQFINSFSVSVKANVKKNIMDSVIKL